jgi:dTDP-D-glucose 4,6-dehydratase
MNSDFLGPVNIGSEEMVTINHLVDLVMNIAGKQLTINHIQGPQGVRGRNSDNRLLREKLSWEPTMKLSDGLAKTYLWIEQQIQKARSFFASTKRVDLGGDHCAAEQGQSHCSSDGSLSLPRADANGLRNDT